VFVGRVGRVLLHDDALKREKASDRVSQLDSARPKTDLRPHRARNVVVNEVGVILQKRRNGEMHEQQPSHRPKGAEKDGSQGADEQAKKFANLQNAPVRQRFLDARRLVRARFAVHSQDHAHCNGRHQHSRRLSRIVESKQNFDDAERTRLGGAANKIFELFRLRVADRAEATDIHGKALLEQTAKAANDGQAT
jgi:hypothetical protein